MRPDTGSFSRSWANTKKRPKRVERLPQNGVQLKFGASRRDPLRDAYLLCQSLTMGPFCRQNKDPLLPGHGFAIFFKGLSLRPVSTYGQFAQQICPGTFGWSRQLGAFGAVRASINNWPPACPFFGELTMPVPVFHIPFIRNATSPLPKACLLCHQQSTCRITVQTQVMEGNVVSKFSFPVLTCNECGKRINQKKCVDFAASVVFGIICGLAGLAVAPQGFLIITPIATILAIVLFTIPRNGTGTNLVRSHVNICGTVRFPGFELPALLFFDKAMAISVGTLMIKALTDPSQYTGSAKRGDILRYLESMTITWRKDPDAARLADEMLAFGESK
jgi:hypothetical protein